MFCITAAELKKIRERFKLSQEQVAIRRGHRTIHDLSLRVWRRISLGGNEQKLRDYIQMLTADAKTPTSPLCQTPTKLAVNETADQLIDAAVKGVAEQMLESLTDTVEKHVAGVHIPAEKLAMLFSRDMTRTEIEAVVDNASIKLAQETEFTIRDMLEEYTKGFTQ